MIYSEVHAGGQGQIREEAHLAMADLGALSTMIFSDGHQPFLEVDTSTHGIRQFQWSVNARGRFTALL